MLELIFWNWIASTGPELGGVEDNQGVVETTEPQSGNGTATGTGTGAGTANGHAQGKEQVSPGKQHVS